MKKLTLLLALAALLACTPKSNEPIDPQNPTNPEEEVTPDDPKDETPFEVEVVSSSSVNIVVDVDPAEGVGNYFVGVWRRSEVGDTPLNDYAEEWIKTYLDRYESFEADNYCIFSGEQRIEELYMVYQMVMETDYYVAVFEVSPKGEIISDVVAVEASTTDVEQSELTIDIKQISASEDSVKVRFDSNQEGAPYFATVIPKSYFSEYGDDATLAMALMQSAGGMGSVSDMVYTISRYESWGPLPEVDYGYAAIAFGVNENYTAATTEVFRCGVECAEEGSDPVMPTEIVIPDVDFGEIILSDNKSGSVKIAIEPNDKEEMYLYSLVTAEQYDSVATSPEALIKSDYQMYSEAAERYGASLATYMNRESIIGDVPATTVAVIVEPLTEMVVYVYGVDLETLQPTTRVKEARFTTPAID